LLPLDKNCELPVPPDRKLSSVLSRAPTAYGRPRRELARKPEGARVKPKPRQVKAAGRKRLNGAHESRTARSRKLGERPPRCTPATVNMAVALVDHQGHLIGKCHNPQADLEAGSGGTARMGTRVACFVSTRTDARTDNVPRPPMPCETGSVTPRPGRVVSSISPRIALARRSALGHAHRRPGLRPVPGNCF